MTLGPTRLLQEQVDEIKYARTNCAAVRGSTSVKKSSLNAKTVREKNNERETCASRTTMHDYER